MAKLHFYYSAMNAGKSTLLLQSAYNYEERGMNTQLYLAKVDNRYQEGIIHSRIGLKRPATVFDPEFDLYQDAKRVHRQTPLRCILVDEAQFLTKAQVFQLAAIVDKLGVPVLAYGLRTDFQANPFPGSTYLLAIADQLLELKTICHCGRKAIMNMRIDQDGKMITSGDQVAIGGNNMYVATCRQHYTAGDSGRLASNDDVTVVTKSIKNPIVVET